MLQLCVCRDIEHLGSLESTQEARVALGCASCNSYATPLSCSPNFPRAQYLDIRTLTHELIVNFSYFYSECLVCLVNFRSAHNLLTNSIFTLLNLIHKSLDGDRIDNIDNLRR